MKKTDKYEQLKKEYPKYISKEQMCKICHISKRKATLLLVNNIVPNIDSCKQTHRFKIKIDDIIVFLRNTESNPNYYTIPKSFASDNNQSVNIEDLNKKELKKITANIKSKLKVYPDVLSLKQVASIMQVNKNTVCKWCSKGQLKYLLIRDEYKIPKKYLLEYITERYKYKPFLTD
ncbi:MAG: helix-turn-helix domain-containing protein [Eubacterium sp.]|nr:helix-turn-helix domain-containing protein [Eubacterium sp.]